MAIDRIVSFLPSATELLYELGLQDKIQGVTHECLYPEDAKTKPKVITSVFDPEKMSSKEINDTTCHLMSEGKDIFKLNQENLLKASPELIISQNTCKVCAAHTNQVKQALDILENKPQMYSMDPHNLQEIIQSVEELASLVGVKEAGKKIQNELESRLKKIIIIQENKPEVLALEWIEPFFTAGHWVPEMIETAGGKNMISKTGEHSRKMTFSEIKNSQPDIIILMPCGFDTDRTILEYEKYLSKDKAWNELKAVKTNSVYAVDANSYFSKPSIRTITGVEILAKIIHPDTFEKILVPDNSFEVIK